MAKKRKNSNYVTAKTIAKQAQNKKQARAKRKRNIIIIAVIALLVVAAVLTGVLIYANKHGWGTDMTVTHHATIEVEGYGTIHLELYGKEAPKTVENFVKLAEDGFYDGLTFHRIMESFMIQGGDPKADGTGGADKDIFGEFKLNGFENDIPHVRGTISMAREGNNYNSASSQFFIVHETSEGNSYSLDGGYAAFGKVTSGMEVVDLICSSAEPTDSNGKIERSEQPVITSISIHAAH